MNRAAVDTQVDEVKISTTALCDPFRGQSYRPPCTLTKDKWFEAVADEDEEVLPASPVGDWRASQPHNKAVNIRVRVIGFTTFTHSPFHRMGRNPSLVIRLSLL